MTGNGFYIPPIKMVIFLGDGVFMALGITHILQLFFYPLWLIVLTVLETHGILM
jgi:hypothetical protein